MIQQRYTATEKRFFQLGDATALLEANSNTYVRNYGLSSLSTLSIRGSSVAQTNVVWNDVPIQNSMLGLTDLSTLPNFFFDEMAVYPSGFNKKGAVQSMAGRLELTSRSAFTEKKIWRTTVLTGYESFGNGLAGAKLNYSNKKWHVAAKYFNRQGANSYRFDNFYKKKEDTITHAFAYQKQWMADVSFRPNKQHQFDLHYWRIQNYRQVAPLAFDANAQRSELNKINRLALNHRFAKNNFLWNSSMGFTSDSFNYEDGLIGLYSVANVKNIPLNSSATYFLNKQSDMGLSYNQQLSFYDQAGRSDDLHQFGLQAFYHHSNIWQGIQANVFLQKQYASIGKNPFTYGLRFSKLFFKKHLVYVSFNTNYRLPTLNELFYFPGGNENLLPEFAKNFELGGEYIFTKKKLTVENKLCLYSRWVDDWIVWTGAAIFFPDNIATVWSRGLENNLNATYQAGDWKFTYSFLLALNRATSQEAYFANDQSVGKQIPYVPRTSWRNNVYLQYKAAHAQLNWSYTGYRFITRDESEFVDPFALLNFYTGYQFVIKKQTIQLQAKVNNLLNENYESVRGRIMPLRNFALSLIWEGVY